MTRPLEWYRVGQKVVIVHLKEIVGERIGTIMEACDTFVRIRVTWPRSGLAKFAMASSLRPCPEVCQKKVPS